MVLGQAGRAQAQAHGSHGAVGTRDDELAAAAADVDDEQLVAHATAPGHAQERQHRLLVMVQDVERDVRARLRLADERGRVEGPPDGLGADDGELPRPEPARGRGVARQRVHDVPASLGPDLAVARDAVAEAQEHGLVEQRLDAVPGDGGHEEMDAVRPDVDRRRR